MKNWQRTLTQTDTHNILGSPYYYCMFLEEFSTIVAPLTTLTKKKVKFELSEMCEKRFHELKNRLTSALMLTLPRSGERVCGVL